MNTSKTIHKVGFALLLIITISTLVSCDYGLEMVEVKLGSYPRKSYI